MASQVAISSGNNLPPPQSPFVVQGDGGLVLSQDGYKFLINLFNKAAQATPSVTVATGQAATGSTQATALQTSTQWVEVTSQKSGGTGVMLQALQGGNSQTIFNRAGVTLKIYPQPGAQIDNLGVNQPFLLANGTDQTFSFKTATGVLL